MNDLLSGGLSFVLREDGSGAILELTDDRGVIRRASRRLRLAAGRRARLLVLSGCLAECAMELGLGASVCGTAHRRPGTPGRLRTRKSS